MYRRRVSRTRRPRATRKEATVTVVRSTNVATLGVLVGGTLTGNLSPTLATVDNADIKAMFRRYRIVKATVTFTPRYDPGVGTTTPSGSFTIACCNDPDGPAVAPASIKDISSYTNSKVSSVLSGQEFKYTYYPRVTNTVWDGTSSVAAGSATASGSWITTANDAVQFGRGYWCIVASDTANTSTWLVRQEYTIACAGLK